RDSGFGIRDSSSYRTAARVQNSVRIERVLDRCAERARVAERTPDIELLFQLCIGAEDDDMPEHVRPRAQPLDHVALDSPAGVDSNFRRRSGFSPNPARTSIAAASSWLLVIAASASTSASARWNVAMSVVEAPGSGISLNVALTIAARLPCDPLTSLPMS